MTDRPDLTELEGLLAEYDALRFGDAWIDTYTALSRGAMNALPFLLTEARRVNAMREVVETAQRLNALKMNDSHPSLETLDLRHALARFSFEDTR